MATLVEEAGRHFVLAKGAPEEIQNNPQVIEAYLGKETVE